MTRRHTDEEIEQAAQRFERLADAMDPAVPRAADTPQRAWLVEQFSKAARQVGGRLIGAPVFGWHDRTAGARLDTPEGPRWLRVIGERERWAHGDTWTGTRDASGPAFDGVPKPELLHQLEWTVGDHQVDADIMSYVPDRAPANDMILRDAVDLAPEWWYALRKALHAVAGIGHTDRVIIGDDPLRHHLLAAFGIDVDLGALDWVVAHGDLHWSNLTAPTLWLLDWEHWGWAPRGYDAAVLHCASILQPEIADHVHQLFADDLDTYSGRIAQLAAITKVLCRVEDGEHLDIAKPLHERAAIVLTQMGQPHIVGRA